MSMNLDVLHQRISEWFEPKNTLPEIHRIEQSASSSFPSRMSHRPGELSPKGAWKVGQA